MTGDFSAIKSARIVLSGVCFLFIGEIMTKLRLKKLHNYVCISKEILYDEKSLESILDTLLIESEEELILKLKKDFKIKIKEQLKKIIEIGFMEGDYDYLTIIMDITFYAHREKIE